MKQLYFWFKGVPPDRAGGPWWHRTFLTTLDTERFMDTLKPFLHAWAMIDGVKLAPGATPECPPMKAVEWAPAHAEPAHAAPKSEDEKLILLAVMRLYARGNDWATANQIGKELGRSRGWVSERFTKLGSMGMLQRKLKVGRGFEYRPTPQQITYYRAMNADWKSA